MTAAAALGRVWLAATSLSTGAIFGLQGLSARAALAAAILGAIALAFRRRPVVRAAGVLIACFGAGAFSGASHASEGILIEDMARAVPRCDVHGRVAERAGGLGTLIVVDELRCEGFASVRDAGTVVSDFSGVDPGARLRASGWLLPLRDNPFDEARRNLGATAFLHVAKMDVGPVDGVLNSLAARFRSSLESATSGLDAERGPLLRGLAVGDTDDIPSLMEEELRRAGLSHLVAVSGSNVAIVLATVTMAAGRARQSIRVALGLVALALYVVIVGPEPSVLRAAVMGAIALAAFAYGRRAEPLSALGLALMAVVAVRPGLALSVGLHLSATATAGIILWARRIERALAPLPRLVAVPLAVTLAAQVAVAPVLALTFGELSLAAPLANLVAAPAVAPATVLALLGGAAGLLAPPGGRILAGAAGPFAGWIAGTGHRLGGDWASVGVPGEVGWGLALAVVVAAALQLPRPVASRP